MRQTLTRLASAVFVAAAATAALGFPAQAASAADGNGAAPSGIQAGVCGYVNQAYIHCLNGGPRTNVWIHVNKSFLTRPDYELCVSEGYTPLGLGTTYAYYVGQLCSDSEVGHTR
jgi:hypothetical protein